MKQFAFLTVAACGLLASLTPGCSTPSKPAPAKGAESPTFPSLGSIERLSPALDGLLAPDARIEKLAEGFDWAEGPVWLKREKALVFSDVPQNTVYRWSERDGITVYLKPSGYTGSVKRGGEPGSNGLTTDADGNLILCQHGDRRISRRGKHGFEPIATHFNYRRFNSPNDLVFNSEGDLYFTDPPYGLEGNNADPQKELMFNGVYLRRKSGEIVLLTKDMTFPNGIALSPDQHTLYVAQSDTNAPIIKAFAVKEDGTIENGRTFFDSSKLLAENRKGVPDGMKVDQAGNLFATGPGGVLVINPSGELLGIINTGEATANCNWGDDGSSLYITADMYLCRVRTLTRGPRF
jgi:gluconolactonase